MESVELWKCNKTVDISVAPMYTYMWRFQLVWYCFQRLLNLAFVHLLESTFVSQTVSSIHTCYMSFEKLSFVHIFVHLSAHVHVVLLVSLCPCSCGLACLYLGYFDICFIHLVSTSTLLCWEAPRQNIENLYLSVLLYSINGIKSI